MTNHRSHARRHGNDARVVNVTQHPAQQRGNHDRNQHRGVNIAGSQNRDNEEAKDTQQHAVGRQVADAHQGFRIGDDHAGVFQAHHTDKQADTAGDADAQANRNIGNHPVAYAENRQQQQANRAPENSAHPHLPWQAHCLYHNKRKKGVQAHCRRQRHREVSE